MSLTEALAEMAQLGGLEAHLSGQEVDHEHLKLTFLKGGEFTVNLDRGNVTLGCSIARGLDGASLSLDDFMTTLDVVQAALLENLDGVQRLPHDSNYPQDFIYRGAENA